MLQVEPRGGLEQVKVFQNVIYKKNSLLIFPSKKPAHTTAQKSLIM